jgi:hypothetical protein
MAKMVGMSEMAKMTTRHVICPIAKNAEKSEMPEMSVITAKHVIHSLGGPAV